MDELTITQLQRIMDWSYPTALKFATLNGVMRYGRWFVMADVIQDEVNELVANANNTNARFNQEVFVPDNVT